MKAAGEKRLLQLNELDEFQFLAYENTKLFKEKKNDGTMLTFSRKNSKLVILFFYSILD